MNCSAKPVVKRGTFWFLSEAYGFPTPFPHRVDQGNTLASMAKSPTATAAPLSLLSQGAVKSSRPDEKPLTRSQQRAQEAGTSATNPVAAIAKPVNAAVPQVFTAPQPHQATFLPPSLQVSKDPSGRPKRKRTTSQFNNSLPRASLPVPPLARAGAVPTGASATALAGDLASSAHRRAFSATTTTSTSTIGAGRPLPGLRKLKLRLPTAAPAALSAADAATAGVPATAALKKAASTPRVPLIRTDSTTKQPLSKRARTQSMSQLPSATSTLFPFDNLHLPLLTPSGQAAPEGTVFPLDIHNLPHWPLGATSAEAALDILTSRSAPEGGIFSPPQGTANIICGPFSRSHSPSASVHIPGSTASQLSISRRGSSFRSLSQADHNSASADELRSIAKLSASLNALDDMHIDADDYADSSFASRSLTDSAILAAQREVLGLLSEQDYHEDMLAGNDDEHERVDDEGIEFDFEASLNSLALSRSRGGGADDLPTIDSADEDDDDSFELGLLRSRSKRDSASRRSQSYVDLAAEAASQPHHQELAGAVDQEEGDMSGNTAVVKQEEIDMLDEDLFDDEEYDDADSEPRAIMDRQATYRALNTTLCPAAGGSGSSGRPGKLSLAKRLNSSSSLVFTRSPLLRPATISRTNSRDVLNTPVPLAELPVIPLMPPQDLLYHIHGSRASGISTPIIKSEEDDADEFGDSTNSSRGGSISRLPSQAPTELEAEDGTDDSASSSADSFRPEAYVQVSQPGEEPAHGTATGATTSRSQSSSRQTSLSPRDSFSPQEDIAGGPHADWALTPPSESEAYAVDDQNEEEEKLLDRATVLGVESVGMDDLEDAWPGARSLVRQTADLSVFEPIMEAPPLPPPVEITPTLAPAKGPTAEEGEDGFTMKSEDIDMVIDDSAVGEEPSAASGSGSGSAAMYIAEEETDMSQSTSSLSSSTSSLTGFLPTAADHGAAASAPGDADADGKTGSAAASSSAAAPVYVENSGWFYAPERPFDFPISILLTEHKVLFYSTIVEVQSPAGEEKETTALLRRVDNDAVDATALLPALLQSEKDKEDDCNEETVKEMAETLRNIKDKGNNWISLVFAKNLVEKYGHGSHVSIPSRLPSK